MIIIIMKDDDDERNCLLCSKMFHCSFHRSVFIPRNFYGLNLQVFLNTFDFLFVKKNLELERLSEFCVLVLGFNDVKFFFSEKELHSGRRA